MSCTSVCISLTLSCILSFVTLLVTRACFSPACLFQKTTGLPENAQVKIRLQLSSPIEEAVITTEEPTATFRSVELGQAILSMSATDADVPLGTATELDLAQVIQLDAMRAQQDYSLEKDFGFGPADDADDDAEPVFVATLKIAFAPSVKDLREELYEMLNKATTRKSQAVERLRQTALAASRSAGATTARSKSEAAVKAGILNKTNKKEEKSAVRALYEKYLGPGSLLRTVVPVAKNYVIFLVFVGVMHYKGDALSLPPPV